MEARELLYVLPAEFRDGLELQIRSAGWNVRVARDTSQAKELIDRHNIHVGLALLDQADGFYREMSELWSVSGYMEWVAALHSESCKSQQFTQLISEYFYDYHTLPVDLDRLLFSLGHAYGMAAMARTIHQQPVEKFSQYEMVGASPEMQGLFRTIRKIASVNAPVLIAGESGTGKELAALAIHERSSRAKGPFVAVNCGALPANLIQSELFGYEKGAFTGAAARRIGHIESAAGGTVFLDEIGDLPHDLQVNLLRFLQEHTIRRVGGTADVHVDVRVIAATHVNLKMAVDEKRFREDLYYRLHVLNLEVPSLRERTGDVELLARFFFDKFSKERRTNVRGFSQKALATMAEYGWPGNVRELINRVRRAMVMSENRLITPEDLGFHGAAPTTQMPMLEETRVEAERTAVLQALRRAQQNVSHAARNLGISRATLYRLIDKHRIRAPEPGGDPARTKD